MEIHSLCRILNGKRKDVELRGQGTTSNVKWPETVQINETWINDDEGLFVKVRVHWEDIAMLVDTLLSEKFIESLPGTITPIMKPVNTTLITATGESTPFQSAQRPLSMMY